MIIGVPAERAPDEKRVALSPSSAAGAIKLGFTVNVQAGAESPPAFLTGSIKSMGPRLSTQSTRSIKPLTSFSKFARH